MPDYTDTRCFRHCSMVTLATVLFLLCAPAAVANLTFNFPGNTFSGDVPSGSLIATFTDITGGVELHIESALGAGENLDPGKALYLNYDGNLASLGFTLTAYSAGFGTSATVTKAADNFKADGDGYFDILFTYSSGSKPFQNGQWQTYMITGTSLSAANFNALSSLTGSDGGHAGGAGSQLAAIHVQGTTGKEGSGWVGASASVPDGGVTLMLLGTALVGVETLRRRLAA